MSLSKVVQQDFSAGMWQSVARHLIPDNGVYDIENGLLDDDGSIYGRGGSGYRSAALAGSAALNAVWDGFLQAGYRTVVASLTSLGVLAADETAMVTADHTFTTSQPQPIKPPSMLGSLLFRLSATGFPGFHAFAGSRKADYTTGTVSVTNGSKIVTGAGTSWSANVDKGMFLTNIGLFGDEPKYRVQTVDSNTQVTLDRAWAEPTAAGQTYKLRQLSMVTVSAAINGNISNATAIGVVPCGGQPRGVLVAGNRAYFSKAGSYLNGDWANDDYHELPNGVEILGCEAIRDTLFLFSTDGVWAIYNMALDLVDDYGNVQHRLEHVARDVVLWGQTGVATLGHRVVLPCLDGVYMLDGISQPKLISQPINTRYRNHVQQGHKPGVGCVFRGHYFLPILDSSNVPVDMLVCRVDRPIQGPGRVTVFPWSRFSGYGLKVRAVAPFYRGGTTNGLLGASSEVARVLNLNFLEPSSANKADADATVPTPQVTSKDHPTGPQNPNIVRRMRVRHETVDASADNPTWSAYVTTDGSASEQALSGAAPEDDGRAPYTWPVNKRTRHFRWRLQGNNAAQSRVLRSVETFIRPSRRP